MPLLFVYLKTQMSSWLGETDEGDGEGERELGCGIQGQKDSLSSWFTLLSVQTFYADIMQMFSGPCSSKSGGVCCLWE